MKITILLLICSSLALAQDCPEHPPMECSPAENWCSGGYDYLSGCQLPDTCEPKRYGNREPGNNSAVIIFLGMEMMDIPVLVTAQLPVLLMKPIVQVT